MKTPPNNPEDDNLIAQFFKSQGIRKQNILFPYAAEVILITRMVSIRQAADFLSGALGRKISTRPITSLIAKHKNGELNITEADIKKAAEADPVSAKWYQFHEQSSAQTSK